MDFATYQNLIDQTKQHCDDGVIAKFYDRLIKTDQTTKDGLPIFKSICYCEIRLRDNTSEVFDQPADSDKINRFPVEYARYKLKQSKAKEGTPLEEFAFLRGCEIEACKYRGIFSIEALAELSDEHAKELGLKDECIKARQFISGSRKIKQGIDLAAQEQKYLKQIAELKAEIARLKKPNKRRKKDEINS